MVHRGFRYGGNLNLLAIGAKSYVAASAGMVAEAKCTAPHPEQIA